MMKRFLIYLLVDISCTVDALSGVLSTLLPVSVSLTSSACARRRPIAALTSLLVRADDETVSRREVTVKVQRDSSRGTRAQERTHRALSGPGLGLTRAWRAAD